MLLLTHSEDRVIRERLSSALTDVEARFTAELVSDLSCVNSLVAHVERYRGKMLRPMLVLVSGLASAPEQDLTESHLIVATVVEMVHMATLVHDDVLDEAQVRRGGGTINHLRGNEAAVMLGDYLISHAYHLCSKLGSTAASRVIADTTNTVCEGELLQLANRGNAGLDERTYFEVIGRKTGRLCGACCRLGSSLSDVPRDVADRMEGYGEKVGVAFQIVDDLLDLVGSEDTVGKTLGKDLQKGKLTLPLIHFLKSAEGPQKRELLALLEQLAQKDGTGPGRGANPPLDPAQVQRIRGMLIANHSVDYASRRANQLIEQAKALLEPLGDSPARAMLLSIADAVLTRKF